MVIFPDDWSPLASDDDDAGIVVAVVSELYLSHVRPQDRRHQRPSLCNSAVVADDAGGGGVSGIADDDDDDLYCHSSTAVPAGDGGGGDGIHGGYYYYYCYMCRGVSSCYHRCVYHHHCVFDSGNWNCHGAADFRTVPQAAAQQTFSLFSFLRSFIHEFMLASYYSL